MAQQIVTIQKKTEALPLGTKYGFANSYEQGAEYSSWYDFLLARLEICRKILNKTPVFPNNTITKVLAIAHNIRADLTRCAAKPFMWDTSERNVMIDHDKITAIVDVDDMCFGDPLFVLGLTYVALESLGFDTVYPDAWAALLNLDPKAQQRLLFYRLFYTAWCMRYYANAISNQRTPDSKPEILNKMFSRALENFK